MKTYKSKIGIALALLILGSFAFSAMAQTPIHPVNPPAKVTLAWNASPGPGVTDYIMYYGTSTGTYTVRTSVGPVLQTTITLPTRGPTYFFAVTASDGTLESVYSNEVSYAPKLPPAPPVMQPVIVLTVQSKPTMDNKTLWADAGMDWSLSPDQSSQFYRLKIAQTGSNQIAQASPGKIAPAGHGKFVPTIPGKIAPTVPSKL